MIDTIILSLFSLAMAANIVALYRHWVMMRILSMTLNNLIEAQRQFNEAIERDRGTTLSPTGD